MERSHVAQSNLFFLLSTAAMGMGCIIVADGDTSDDGAGSDTMPPKDLTTSDTGDETGQPPADGTGTGTGTGGGGTTGDGTGASQTTGDVDLCVGYATTYAECIGDPKAYDPTLTYCQDYVDGAFAYSDDCGDSVQGLLACLSALDCRQFLDPDACLDEQTKVEETCPVVKP